MLWKLLVEYLRPQRRLLLAVVVFQLAASIASLYLPTLNADIIDQGVATGDTDYILRVGGLMLAVTLLQVICTVVAVYFGAKAAMALGRDVRGAIFSRVAAFSEQEVTRFGPPSLITRSTNDVQQVQQLVLMSATLMVTAPMLCIGGVIMAIRQDLQLSWLIAVSVPVLLAAVGSIILRMVPLFRVMQARIDTVNRVLREQLTGIRVVRAFVREDVETARFARANEDVTDTALRAGRLMALAFPTVMLVLNVSSTAVIWFGAFRIEDGSMQVGTMIAFLSYLMQILMSVMMATFMAIMIPRAAVSRGPDRRGPRDRIQRPAAAAPGFARGRAGSPWRAGDARRRVRLPGCRAAGAVGRELHRPRGADDGDHRQHRLRQDHPGEPDAAALRRDLRFGPD